MNKILQLLAASCFLFIASATAQQDIKVEVLSQTTTSWDGTTLPNYQLGQAEVSIIKVTIPANTTLALHKHPIINAGYLLKGNLTVVSEDNKTLKLTAGDTIVELVNKWHYGKNESTEDAEILVFYAGTKGQPLSIKHK